MTPMRKGYKQVTDVLLIPFHNLLSETTIPFASSQAMIPWFTGTIMQEHARIPILTAPAKATPFFRCGKYRGF